MQKTDEFIQNRIKWRAGKYTLSTGYTFFFDELSHEIKQYLMTFLDRNLSGTPVIFFTKPSKEWTLVCTKQVIGYDSQKIFKLNFNDITRIRGFNQKKIKTDWDELNIFDKQNDQYILHTNNGYDHAALHNILLMLSGMTNRS